MGMSESFRFVTHSSVLEQMSNMKYLWLFCLTISCTNGSPAPLPVGPSLNSNTAAAALAGIAVAAKLSEDECDDVGIQDQFCAALYDEEKCKRSEDYLELRNGDQGVLPLLTTGLRRNDVESLIVRYRCKLELWDDDEGLENGSAPDLVLTELAEQILEGTSMLIVWLMMMITDTWMKRFLPTDALASQWNKSSSFNFQAWLIKIQFKKHFFLIFRCTCRESTFGK